MATVNTIFDSTASPQTGIGDGFGAWYKVRGKGGTSRTGQVADTETISILITGSLNSAVVKAVIAHDLTESPIRQAYASNPKDDGTTTAVTYSATGAYNLELPSNVYFTLEISGSGSPLPALRVTAVGEIEAA